MTLFSTREGFNTARTIVQTDTMDTALRNRLWNVIHGFYFEPVSFDRWPTYYKALRLILHSFYTNRLKLTVDDVPDEWFALYQNFKSKYDRGPWYLPYDFIEHILEVENTLMANDLIYAESHGPQAHQFIEVCNSILEQEMSAWRIVGGRFAKLSAKEEMEAIETALSYSGVLSPVSQQLTEALRLMSLRPAPNYRDSIKNSINAIETTCKIITKLPSSNLSQALIAIEKQSTISLHSQLNEGFRRLYNWTSDASGIRHGLMDEPSVDFDDAKYMLVSCSAFCHYLIGKAQRAGISLE